jgi:hypothetical protein
MWNNAALRVWCISAALADLENIRQKASFTLHPIPLMFDIHHSLP